MSVQHVLMRISIQPRIQQRIVPPYNNPRVHGALPESASRIPPNTGGSPSKCTFTIMLPIYVRLALSPNVASHLSFNCIPMYRYKSGECLLIAFPLDTLLTGFAASVHVFRATGFNQLKSSTAAARSQVSPAEMTTPAPPG